MRAACGLVVLAILMASGVPGVAAAQVDRLARFSELGRALSGVDEASAPIDPEAIVAELFAVADAEILDNLRSGEPFASVGFIQDRLDAFMSTWGGVGFRVHRLGSPKSPASVTVGVFTVAGSAPYGSVRGYGRTAAGDVGLLAAIKHEGTPEIHPWPSARDGTPQLFVAWRGPPSGAGARPLAASVWRSGGGGMEEVWSTATAFPAGLWALAFSVKSGEMSVRQEARYPGWKPGCSGQTELIDVWRAENRRARPVLASRRVVNGWHRELQATVGRLLAALDEGRASTLAELVPDRALRARLPRALTAEPACDQAGAGTPPKAVAVAATEDRSGRMIPWSLAWRRAPRGWRLTGAAPMLE